MSRFSARTAAAIAVVAPAVTPLAAQEQVRPGQQVSITGQRLEVFDAVGTITLRAGTQFGVTATAEGPDGSQLRFLVDRDGEWTVLRVAFPEDVDEIAAPDGVTGQRTTLRLRADGSFGGDANDGDGTWWRRLGRDRRGGEVDIGGRRGFRGWANLEITVPEGRELRIHLALGQVVAEGVNGEVFVDTWSAGARATNIAGSWLFDTGSGDVEVRGSRGTLRIDTGSGGTDVADVTGDLLDVDTGSGGVDATNVRVDRFRFDTGSGAVRATNIVARRGVADTGSGSVTLEYGDGPIDDLVVDTGSGGVRLRLPAQVDARLRIDTGSGGINLNRSGAIFERRDEEGMVLRFGEGRGRIRIDTGSGGVTVR